MRHRHSLSLGGFVPGDRPARETDNKLHRDRPHRVPHLPGGLLEMTRAFPVLTAILFFALCLYATLAMSHDWYDPICCNKNDCRPVDLLSVKKGVYSWRSWRKPEHVLSIHIDDKRVKQSRDSQFHACEAPYADTGNVSPSPVKIHCVYIGAGG